MKFSELWLREWVNPAIDSDALSNQITMAGLKLTVWNLFPARSTALWWVKWLNVASTRTLTNCVSPK